MRKVLIVLFALLFLLFCVFGCQKRQEGEEENLVIRIETDVKLFMIKVTSDAFSEAFIREDGQDLEKGKRVCFALPEGKYRYAVSLYGKDELVVKRAAFVVDFSSEGNRKIYLIVTGTSEADLRILAAR